MPEGNGKGAQAATGGPVQASSARERAVAEFHGQGLGRNEIAAELGIGKATVSRIAVKLGLSFDRTATKAATAARVADAAALRAELQVGMLLDAQRLRSELFAPCVAFNFGGKDNTYEERALDAPPVADKLKLVQAVAAAVGSSLKLAEHDSGIDRETFNLVIATARHLGLGDDGD